MSKKDNINKLTNFLALAIVHKIGSVVNPLELYTAKYKKEADNYFAQAKAISLTENWNLYDKSEIKKITRKKLIDELNKRPYLDEHKFRLIDEEIEKALRKLDLL